MFIINGNKVKDSFLCGKAKANYIIKHYGLQPFYNKNGTYFFAINKDSIKFPWYLRWAK